MSFVKPMYVIILIVVIAASMFEGYKVYHRIYSIANLSRRFGNQETGTIPRNGDLCEGTGGNGKIVSLGNNAFTLKPKNGSNRIIHLASQVTIKISASSPLASEASLKVGDRVTLVGGPNPDGSFSANGVYVCGGN